MSDFQINLPATNPASPEAKEVTAAIERFARNICAADAAAAKKQVYAKAPELKQFAYSHIDQDVADIELERAMVKRFDEETAASLLEAGQVKTRDDWRKRVLDRLEQAEVSMNDQSAAVWLGEDNGPWLMIRKDGDWLVSHALFADDPTLERQINENEERTSRTRRITREIVNGTFKDLAHLRQALENRNDFIDSAPADVDERDPEK